MNPHYVFIAVGLGVAILGSAVIGWTEWMLRRMKK